MIVSEVVKKKAAAVRFAEDCLAGLERARQLRPEVVAPGPPIRETTLARYHELLRAASGSNAYAGLMSEVHPDEAIRDAESVRKN